MSALRSSLHVLHGANGLSLRWLRQRPATSSGHTQSWTILRARSTFHATRGPSCSRIADLRPGGVCWTLC